MHTSSAGEGVRHITLALATLALTEIKTGS